MQFFNDEIYKIHITSENFRKIFTLFNDHPRYGIGDRVINDLVTKYPENKKLEDIILKVMMLNSIYATAVFDTYKLADHIFQLKELDHLFLDGDPEAVDKIKQGHGIITKRGKERNFYSFSTKYCFFHNKNSYPIFDSIMVELLKKYNTKYNFSPSLLNGDFQNYRTYKEIILKFKNHFKITDLTIEKFDHAMWLIGKYAFKKVSDNDYKWLEEQFKKII